MLLTEVTVMPSILSESAVMKHSVVTAHVLIKWLRDIGS